MSDRAIPFDETTRRAAEIVIAAHDRLSSAIRGYCRLQVTILERLTGLAAFEQAEQLGDLLELRGLRRLRRQLGTTSAVAELRSLHAQLVGSMDLDTLSMYQDHLRSGSLALVAWDRAYRHWADVSRDLNAAGGLECDTDVLRWRDAGLAALRADLAFLDHIDAAVAEVRAMAAAPDALDPRPAAPTVAWCLLPGFQARWQGEPVRLKPQLHQLLAYLLAENAYPLEAAEVADRVWGDSCVNQKTLANRLSELNNDLLPTDFPWTWHMKKGHVYRQDG
jgi:hypothetical protein